MQFTLQQVQGWCVLMLPNLQRRHSLCCHCLPSDASLYILLNFNRCQAICSNNMCITEPFSCSKPCSVVDDTNTAPGTS